MSAFLQESSPLFFEREPTGRYVRGPHWTYFCLSEDVYGYALFGRVSADDLQRLTKFMRGEFRRKPHRVLAHLAHLEAAEAAAFAALADFVEEHREALGKVVRDAAIIRPAGMSGALASGFFAVVEAPFSVDVFDNTPAALERLQLADAPQVGAALDKQVAEWIGTPATVAILRTYLRTALLKPDMAAAATALSMSTRTLQRRLTSEGTGFQREVMLTRLDAVVRQLEQSDQAISSIAFDAGFSSPQHMSRAFKAHFGESPGDYRTRHR